MRTNGEYGAAADAGRTRAQIRLSPFPESLAAGSRQVSRGITRHAESRGFGESLSRLQVPVRVHLCVKHLTVRITDGVSDALAYDLRQLRDLRPLRHSLQQNPIGLTGTPDTVAPHSFADPLETAPAFFVMKFGISEALPDYLRRFHAA